MHSLLCFLILSFLCQYFTHEARANRSQKLFQSGERLSLVPLWVTFYSTPLLLKKKKQSRSLHLYKEHLLHIVFYLLRKVTKSNIRAKEKETKIDFPATKTSCHYVQSAGSRDKSADCVVRYSYNFITVNVFHSWSSLMLSLLHFYLYFLNS